MKNLYGDIGAQDVSGRIATPQASTTALKSIPADRRVHGMLALVGSTLYRYDSTAASGAGSLVPDAGTGVWLPVSGTAGGSGESTLAARNVVTSNVTLASFTVAADQSVNDDVLNVEGDIVLLIGQTTAADNGLYVVGAVAVGVAPLTRAWTLPAGTVLDEHSAVVTLAEGNRFAGSNFKNTVAVTVGTTDPVFRLSEVMPVAFGVQQIRVRTIVHTNVADLTAMVVTANAAYNDNVLVVENNLVLLVAQTDPIQNGVYVVGTVTGATAPITRLAAMPVGMTFRPGQFEIQTTMGDVYSHTKWFNAAATASPLVIGTGAISFYPESLTQTVALVAGTKTIANVPIYSATKSGVSVTRSTPNTSAATVMYAMNGNPTPGAIGTASLEVFATVAAGTINNADVSTIHITVTNR